MKTALKKRLVESWKSFRALVGRARAANQQDWNRPGDTLELGNTRCVSVIVPALNEGRHIGAVVAFALSDPMVHEVIVIDDSSTDDTVEKATEAGARVITSSFLGKGASMLDGVRLASCEVVAYLDGDLRGLRAGLIADLCAPILNDDADFIKARFGRSGGRVTELTAKPMIRIFFPELAHLAQPLGGVIAARRALLRTLRFEDGYGVDVGLLIDASLAGARIGEIDIGSLEHDPQPLHDLTLMANEVGRVIFERARWAGRMNVDQIAAMYEAQRHATGTLEIAMNRRRGRKKLLLLDLDGTVTVEPFARALAEATGHQEEYRRALEAAAAGEKPVEQAMTEALRYVHRNRFEQVAKRIELRPGLVETVNQLRRAGFFVGVISNGWFVAADIIRKRIFADFAIAHMVHFENEVCSGKLRINPAFLPDDSEPTAVQPCKGTVLAALKREALPEGFDLVWAVGNDVDDLPMLRLADRAFVVGDRAEALINQLPGATVLQHFGDLVIPDPEAAIAA